MPRLKQFLSYWYNFTMKLLIISMTLIFSLFLAAQELTPAFIQESFRLLESAPQGPVVSCFDYIPSQTPEIGQTRNAGGCPRQYERIPVNHHRLMRRRNNYQSGNYLLTRPSENKYQAILNLNFIPGVQGTDHGAGTPELARQLLQRTRNCLREMAPYMKGPNDEEFEILVSTPDETLPRGVPRPRAIDIKVSQQADDYRGDANNFGSEFQCFTIGHEILHHLGLCDEYHEGILEDTNGNRRADWSCRPVTTEPSFMRNMRFAYNTTVPQTARCVCDHKCQKIMENEKARNIYLAMNAQEILIDESSMVAPNTTHNPNRQLCRVESTKNLEGVIPNKAFEYAGEKSQGTHRFFSHRVFVADHGAIFYERVVHKCICPPNHPYCNRMIQQLKVQANQSPKRATCPDGTTSRSKSPSIGYDRQGTRLDSDQCQGEGSNRICDLVITNPGNSESLLKPNHFNRILAGNCRGGAIAYETCEPYAYMGRGESCDEMPTDCNSDGYLLHGILNQSSSSQ